MRCNARPSLPKGRAFRLPYVAGTSNTARLTRVCIRCRAGKAVAAGLCAACVTLGGMTAAETPAGHAGRPVAAVSVRPQPAEHAEQPHIPEIEVAYPAGLTPVTVQPTVFTLDDPVLGQLDGIGQLA